jgi:hypothetical protein
MNHPISADGIPLITVCSYCNKAAWPPGPGAMAQEWIELDDFRRRTGWAGTRVSHGICPHCYSLQFPDNKTP